MTERSQFVPILGVVVVLCLYHKELVHVSTNHSSVLAWKDHRYQTWQQGILTKLQVIASC